MPDITPLKVIRTAGDTTALSEFNTGDTVPVANGGTGGTDASTARTNLGLAIGSDVQAYDADIATVAASQAEMEAGTETALRSMSPLNVAQAISALGGGSGSAGALGVAPEYTSTNKTLTSASSGYQIVTANSVEYTLPDATTLTESALLFIFQNDGADVVIVNDSNGDLVSSVAPNLTVAVNLEDGGAASGTWSVLFKYSQGTYDLAIPETATVFESASTSYTSVVMISSTQALVCYRDSGNSSYGTACILNISGSTITPATPVVFESAITIYISVSLLSATQAIVCYADAGNSSYGTSCILNISGSTISPATPVVFESASTSYTSVTTLSSTQALVCYRDSGNSGYGTACILNISGSTITPATPAVFESAGTSYISAAALSSTQAIVCYRDEGNSNYGTSCILNISGSTITTATPSVFESAASLYIAVCALSSDQAIVCYSDSSSTLGKARSLDVIGSTVTASTPAVFEPTDAWYCAVTTLSSTQALVCYRDDGNSSYGTACILDISGSTIAPATPVVFESASTSYTSVTMLSSTQAIVCYTDYGNSAYGTANLLITG